MRGVTGAHMTVGAKLTCVVAIAAARLSGICCSGVTREEAARMVPWRSIGSVGPVAVETLRTDMAAVAARRPGVGRGTMQLGKVRTVGSRALPSDYGASAAPRATGGQSESGRGLVYMTSEAALLGMAGCT